MVHVAARGEVTALDQPHLAVTEVVPGAAVTGRHCRHAGPVVAAEHDGVTP